VAPSTRHSYSAAFKSWSSFCDQRGTDPHGPISNGAAEEWISALADGGRISAATIRTYKAGMSTHHTETSTLSNPFQTARLFRIITGVENDKAPREAIRRREKPKSEGFTQNDLSIVNERIMHGTEKEIMMGAAAALLYGAALRPNEALGNRTKEPLRTNQVHFFASRSDKQPMIIPSSARSNDQPAPHHIIIELHGSKTNQLHREENLVYTESLAIGMIWRWMRIRRERPSGTLDPFLFTLPTRNPSTTESRRLNGRTLIDFLRIVVAERQRRPHWTPKCFRIGATSDFHASGADPAGLRYLGRWRTNIWQTYADTRSHIERAIAARTIKK
jgi:hypothetical protein